MAKYSAKMMGKEVGDAGVYAEPHTMQGKKVDAATVLPVQTGASRINEMNPSVGGLSKGNYPAAKTTGIETRGNGAATKGRIARGPMA
jgi:hypothetical protein